MRDVFLFLKEPVVFSVGSFCVFVKVLDPKDQQILALRQFGQRRFLSCWVSEAREAVFF